MPWKKARKLIKEDPRYKNFGDSDHVSEHNSVKCLSLIRTLTPQPSVIQGGGPHGTAYGYIACLAMLVQLL